MDPPPRGSKKLDVGGPSELKEKSTSIQKKKQNETDSSKANCVTPNTTLTKKPRHKLGTLSPTPDSSSDELSTIWDQVSQPTPPTPNY